MKNSLVAVVQTVLYMLMEKYTIVLFSMIWFCVRQK